MASSWSHWTSNGSLNSTAWDKLNETLEQPLVMANIRVLIVDDSALVRQIITKELAGDPSVEVVGTASNGRMALAKIPQVNPDVITLDVEMPEMDGLATLRAIREIYPRLPVIMFSSVTERSAEVTLD